MSTKQSLTKEISDELVKEYGRLAAGQVGPSTVVVRAVTAADRREYILAVREFTKENANETDVSKRLVGDALQTKIAAMTDESAMKAVVWESDDGYKDLPAHGDGIMGLVNQASGYFDDQTVPSFFFQVEAENEGAADECAKGLTGYFDAMSPAPSTAKRLANEFIGEEFLPMVKASKEALGVVATTSFGIYVMRALTTAEHEQMTKTIPEQWDLDGALMRAGLVLCHLANVGVNHTMDPEDVTSIMPMYDRDALLNGLNTMNGIQAINVIDL